MSIEAQTHRPVSGLGISLVMLCGLGLIVELSRPHSPLGWLLRGLYQGTYGEELQKWRDGTLTVSAIDIDVMTRTTIGEAAMEPTVGKIAVIHVMMNRARKNVSWYGGNNVSDVALHKSIVVKEDGRRVMVWQFEPWMTRRDYLWNISKNSKLYKEVRELVVGCVEGKYVDPTEGATHFLEPNIVRARTGGTLPKWASGQGRRIGSHVFYKL